jgi:hypothetical protein
VKTEENEASSANETNAANEALNQSNELTVEANAANEALNQSNELTVEANEPSKPSSQQRALSLVLPLGFLLVFWLGWVAWRRRDWILGLPSLSVLVFPFLGLEASGSRAFWYVVT